MSISENKQKHFQGAKRTLGVYLGITVFCFVFFLIYDRFSHGVRSPYMTFLFAWPLVLGLLPAFIVYLFPRPGRAGRWSRNLYHSGVACVTVSSLLRGIFEIAGNSSVYQRYLMYAGALFLILGAALYAAGLLFLGGSPERGRQ